MATDHTDHVDHLLAQWAVERPGFDTAALALSARVVRLERFLSRRGAEVLVGFELTEGEANVLAALRRTGAPYELTPSQLSTALLLSSGAMTNRLDRLEARGLVTRSPDHDDRRRIRVQLTGAGREVIDAAMDAHVVALEAALAALDDDQRSALATLLRCALAALEAEEGADQPPLGD